MHFYSWILVTQHGDTSHRNYINLHTLIVVMSDANGNTQNAWVSQKDAVGSQFLVLGMLFIQV